MSVQDTTVLLPGAFALRRSQLQGHIDQYLLPLPTMSSPSTVALHTLGCKLNFAESSSIRQRFEERGFQIAGFDQEADVYVINTCSVTEFADRKCRQAVRRALRQNPNARIAVIGCYAQLKPKEISEIEGVDLVLGAAEKFQIVDYVESLGQQREKGLVVNSDIKTVNSFEEAFSYGDRTRSFLKIQDGCDYNCSFCTIPLARGASRSGDPEQILRQIHELEARGTKEVILTGVNIGDYGKGLQSSTNFFELIQRIEAESTIPRFRISSIEPNLCSDEIIEFVARSTRFMPHFHMPLQSGSDRILGLMRRRYRRKLYANRVERIKDLMSHACIGADVIVGFPGETDKDFIDTCQFLEDLAVNYLHVFTYSQRANTLAATKEEQIPLNVRRGRSEILRQLSAKKKRAFYTKYLSTRRELLVEPKDAKGTQSGFTDNYIKVELALEGDLTNQLVYVELDRVGSSGMMEGHLVANEAVALD